MAFFGGHSARFLFRSDEGRIGAGVWLRGFIFLIALLVVLTAVWLGVAPLGRIVVRMQRADRRLDFGFATHPAIGARHLRDGRS